MMVGGLDNEREGGQSWIGVLRFDVDEDGGVVTQL